MIFFGFSNYGHNLLFTALRFVILIVSGAVSVGYVNDKIVINPTRSEMINSLLNLMVSVIPGQKIGQLLLNSHKQLI